MVEEKTNEKNEMLELNDDGKWLFNKYELNWRELPSFPKEDIEKKLSERIVDFHLKEHSSLNVYQRNKFRELIAGVKEIECRAESEKIRADALEMKNSKLIKKLNRIPKNITDAYSNCIVLGESLSEVEKWYYKYSPNLHWLTTNEWKELKWILKGDK